MEDRVSSLADFATSGRPQPAWTQLMAKRRRKTLVACQPCHDIIHARRPVVTGDPMRRKTVLAGTSPRRTQAWTPAYRPERSVPASTKGSSNPAMGPGSPGHQCGRLDRLARTDPAESYVPSASHPARNYASALRPRDHYRAHPPGRPEALTFTIPTRTPTPPEGTGAPPSPQGQEALVYHPKDTTQDHQRFKDRCGRQERSRLNNKPRTVIDLRK